MVDIGDGEWTCRGNIDFKGNIQIGIRLTIDKLLSLLSLQMLLIRLQPCQFNDVAQISRGIRARSSFYTEEQLAMRGPGVTRKHGNH